MSAAGRFPRLEVRGEVGTLLVVFGDQLDPRSEVLRRLDRERDAVLMMEVAEEATHVPSHKQRTALFLSAMRHFALELAERGFRVRYVTLEARGNTQSFDGEVERACRDLGPRRLLCVEPGEWRVDAKVRRWSSRLGLPLEVLADGHFLVSREAFAAWAEGRSQLVMEHFYRRQRRALGVLIDGDGEPMGGRWNFDRENRRAFRRAPSVPRPYRARNDAITAEVLALVERRFPAAPGRLDGFAWPVTRAQARRALASFVAGRLARFGRYQDAMWTGEPYLYHSLLSPCLNLKLLDPRECVAAAVAAYEAGRAPIASVEAFVRQIIGWREFIRGVYWWAGPDYRRRNELGEHRPLPAIYWTADTPMRCMREALGQVLAHGYGHHIQRLMISGNFALTAGVDPAAVSAWYLGMYVDAVDWVTLPNTLGMVMHADGGVVGTKPYAASGRYVDRMSNYCRGCDFDVDRRAGDGACPFNVFYWDFLIRQRQRLEKNPRMRMILRHLERMSGDERRAIGEQAARLRRRPGIAAPPADAEDG